MTNEQPTLDATALYAYLCKQQPTMAGGKIVGFKLGKRDYRLEIEYEDYTAKFWGNIAKVSKRMAEASS